MRKMRLIGFAVAFGFLLALGAPVSAAQLTERRFETPQGPRAFIEAAPTTLRPGAPIVVLLHGGGQSMRKIMRQAPTRRFVDLAEREGFLLLVPNATNADTGDAFGDRQNWNDLREDAQKGSAAADDVGFLTALVAAALRERSGDPDRVYVTGASNGGMMTYRLLIERPDVFAAGAAFIANLPAAEPARPQSPSPLLIVNATQDPLMPYAGGMVVGNRGQVRSSAATFEWFARANGLDPGAAQERALPDVDGADSCVPSERRLGPPDREVVVVTLSGGGHFWPSQAAEPPSRMMRRVLGPAQCRDFEGADVAWDFLKTRRR